MILLLLLFLQTTTAIAPRDEDTDCNVPYYPPNINVLLDSWRYRGMNFIAQSQSVSSYIVCISNDILPDNV